MMAPIRDQHPPRRAGWVLGSCSHTSRVAIRSDIGRRQQEPAAGGPSTKVRHTAGCVAVSSDKATESIRST
jgi:hypothetical protein